MSSDYMVPVHRFGRDKEGCYRAVWLQSSQWEGAITEERWYNPVACTC